MVFEKIVKRFIILCMGITVSIGMTASSSAGVDEFHRVVVLHSFHKGQKWNDNLSHGIEDVLKINQIELSFEYMDTIRYPEGGQIKHLEALLAYKYGHKKVDVVISTDEEALDFLLVNRGLLFPDASIVYCGIKYDIDRFWVPKLTGVIEAVDLPSNIRIAQILNPDLKEVYVVMDTTPTSMALVNNFISLMKTYSPVLSFHFAEFVDFEVLLQNVRKLSQNSAVFLVNYTQDKSGKVLSMEESAKRITRNSPVPVYSVWDSYMGQGILGGKMVSGYTQGHMAAQIALRILNGESADEIPVQTSSPSQYVFDFQQLQKFQIDEAKLPPNSIIHNQPDTLYQRYKRLILIVVVSSLGFSLIIFLLSINIIHRHRVERSLKRYSIRLNFLHRIDQTILKNFTLNAIATDILSPTLAITECEVIGLFLLKRDLFPEWAVAIRRTDRLSDRSEGQNDVFSDFSIPVDQLPKEIVWLKRTVRLGEREKKIKKQLFQHEAFKDIDWYLLMPLIFQDHLLGVFYLGNGKPIDADQETVCRQITQSLAMAIQNDYLFKEIKAHEARLRHMSLNILGAQETERKRLSAELHDEFGQILTGIAINFSVIRKKISQSFPPGLVSRMGEIEEAIDYLSDHVHHLSLDLRPPMLEDLGLIPTFRWYTAQFKERSGIEIELQMDQKDKYPVPGPLSITMYRILQEALNNIAKHAKATCVSVRLNMTTHRIWLEIEDNGIGFDVAAVRASHIGTRGLGLIGMRERLDLLDGSLDIQSQSGQGSTITATAPISEEKTYEKN